MRSNLKWGSITMTMHCYWNFKKIWASFLICLGSILVIRNKCLCSSFVNHQFVKPLGRIRIEAYLDTYNNAHCGENIKHVTASSGNLKISVPFRKTRNSKSSERRTRKFSGHKNYIQNNPGAYADLSDDELKDLTQNLLNKSEVGEMTKQSLHEAQKLIASWSKRNSRSKGDMSELLLKRMINESKEGNTNSRVTVNLFNSVINAWAKCGLENGLEKAANVLDLMMEQEFNDLGNLKAFTKCYASLLDGLCKSKRPGSADAAVEVLESLVSLPHSQAEAKHFNSVMNVWVETKLGNSTQYVQKILDKMILLHNQGNQKVKPNTETYNIVLKSFVKSNRKNSISEADSLLRKMEASLFNDHDSVIARPDRISYTTVLLGWAKSKQSKAIEKASNILIRMERLSKFGHGSVKPDTMTYNILLNALASVNKKDSAEECVKILFKMEKLHAYGDKNVKPDVISYNTALNAYAKSNRRRASVKALSLLRHMEISYERDISRAKPDIVTYNSVLATVARSKDQSAPFKAEEILNDIEKNYKSGLSDAKPDLYTYNTVMSSWANCGRDDAGEKAESIFRRITELYELGDSSMAPDTTTYNTLLTAWSRTQSHYSAGRAQLIFDKMLELYKDGNRNVKPSVQSFVAVINAWSKSKEPLKAKKAQMLLEKMKVLYKGGNPQLRPNIFVYTSVLNSCAYTFGKVEFRQQAMDIAIEIFGEMQTLPYIKLNHVAYGTFLKACRSLLRDDIARKNALIEATLRQCIRDGQVGDIVLKQLVDIDPPEFKMKLLGRFSQHNNDVLCMADIPDEWSSNVNDRKKLSP